MANGGQNNFLAFLQWRKMNTKVARQNLADDEAAWAENLQPIGPNDWTTVNGPATSLTTITGKTVARQFPAGIGGVDYIVFFATDGSCTAVDANAGTQTIIAGPGFFSVTPDMTTYASQRILIVDPIGGYATWDGTLFVGSGGISPNINVTSGGSGYSAPPLVTLNGGSGGGATATAVMGGSGSAQFVVAVTLTNPGSGYKPGDAITVLFTGANTTIATATARIWPQVKGITIDVFAGRVWWASLTGSNNYRILNFTGTAGYDDTNPANAAGATTLLDQDLPHDITAIRNRNNYLYIFGDGSVRQIGSITVSSSITLFTPLTLASDIGTTFPLTIQSYNRLVLFANKAGVYGIFGASIKKISDDLDGIFQLIDFTLPMSSSINDLHQTLTSGGSIHVYMLLVSYVDPVQGTRPIILTFQDNQWFIITQGALKNICSIFLKTAQQWDTFGSSGADVTQLAQQPGANVAVLFKTALSSHKKPLGGKRLIRGGAAVTSQTAQTFTLLVETENTADSHALQAVAAVNWVNNSQQMIQWQNNSLQNINWITGGFRFPYTQAYGEGKVIGATLSGSLMNFSLNQMAFEYVDTAIWQTTP